MLPASVVKDEKTSATTGHSNNTRTAHSKQTIDIPWLAYLVDEDPWSFGLIDDYESTYHWLSIDVNGLLSSSAKEVFPDFINIAIGHSVKNLDGFGGGNHELYISLDWDFEALPGESSFWRTIKRWLNFYHFPAPAVKIYPDVVWYGLKFWYICFESFTRRRIAVNRQIKLNSFQFLHNLVNQSCTNSPNDFTIGFVD